MNRASSFTRITSEQARQALAEVDIPWIENRTRIVVRFNIEKSEVAGKCLINELFTTVGIVADTLSSLGMAKLAEKIRSQAKPGQMILFRTITTTVA
jgi:hypothetical protein